MEFRDTLTALLPSPRDDEPAGLRQDILDELGDHLVCAYNRELLRGVDASVAQARAWERFGDPAAVARRLWLDAMKGKIVAQRALIVTCMVVTIVSLSLGGLLWLHSTETARQLAEAQRRMAEAMAQAQTTNQEMLRQLQGMAKGDQSTQSADWISVTFKLTQETLEGPPAAGYKVYLGRGNNGSMSAGAIHRESDEKGLVDFGVVQPGDWEFRIFRPAEDGRTWRAQGSINVLPGAKIAKDVICPEDYSENIHVRLRVDWPADLADQGLHVAAQFGFAGITYQPPLRWQLQGPGNDRIRNVLCRPGPKLAEIVDDSHFFLWQVRSDGQRRVFADLPSDSLLPTSDTIALAAGNYRLIRLIVLRPILVRPPDSSVERFDFIAQVLRPPFATAVSDRSHMHVYRLESAPSGKMDSKVDDSRGPDHPDSFSFFPSSYLTLNKGQFDVRAGQVKELVIPLPDELIKVVREKLKVSATASTK